MPTNGSKLNAAAPEAQLLDSTAEWNLKARFALPPALKNTTVIRNGTQLSYEMDVSLV